MFQCINVEAENSFNIKDDYNYNERTIIVQNETKLSKGHCVFVK